MKRVMIPRGSNLHQIIKTLEQGDILRHPRLFWLRVKLLRKESQLQAGEYDLACPMSHKEILIYLIEGRVVRHRITIPEGFSVKEIAALLERAGFGKKELFIKETQNEEFLKELEIPAKSAEGFLYPSTYFLVRDLSAQELIREMVKNYRRVFNRRARQRAKELGFTELQVVTLASIVEKETGQETERPLISSVFHNRLKKKMRLQSDPTTIYGLADFNGNLTRKHLETYSPYNTYVISGLPPGPIANPGRGALEAALYPAESAYLYFVSRNDGSHVFSATFKEHNDAVNQFQRKRVARKQEKKGKMGKMGKR